MINVAAAQVNGTASAGVSPEPVPAPVAAPNTKGDSAQACESGVSRGTVSPATFHDFRDRGDPMIKVYPDPHHWNRWAERSGFDPTTGAWI